MSNRPIQQLNDIEDIKQLKARYCRLIDQKKWSELESDFVPDAAIEIAGAPGGADDTQRFTSAHEFVEGLKKLMGPQAHATWMASRTCLPMKSNGLCGIQ